MKIENLIKSIGKVFSRKRLFTRTADDTEISAEEAKRILAQDSNAILLDVRSIAEYNEGHILGAIVITDYELEKDILRVITDKNETIMVYCTKGARSKKAVTLLRSLGYMNSYSITGGLESWY